MKRSKNRAGGNAFTLVEILVVIAIIGILFGIAVPNFIKSRELSRAKSCAQNLRIIELAKDQYLMDNHLPNTALVHASDIIGPDKYIRTMPVCPSGGTYDIRHGDEDATCSQEGAHNRRGR